MRTLRLKDGSANPAPLGLVAFGMTTLLLNVHNAGLFDLDSMLLSMAIFYGGIAQVIAGVMEWKKGNTFGATAFVSYGMFWLTLATLLVFGKTGLMPAPAEVSMAAFFLAWGLFTLVMFIGTFKLSRPLQWVFGTLTLLFFLLTARELAGQSDTGAVLGAIAGFEGIFCGLCAMYAGLSQVLRELFLPQSESEKAEDERTGNESDEKTLLFLAQATSKSTIDRLMPSIIAYVKKHLERGPGPGAP